VEGDYATQSAAGATGAKTATAAGSGGDSDIGATHILALRGAVVVATPQLYFIHADHLNTPRLIANASQQTVWKWDQQEPFGVNSPDENPSSLGTFEFTLRFPGQYADKETNLNYNYFRDYDSALGRYVESDPIGLRGGTNTYAYVANVPVSMNDPTGELPPSLLGRGPQALEEGSADYYQMAIPIPGASSGAVGASFIGTVDRWGGIYFGSGAGAGWPAWGVQAGRLDQQPATPESVRDFIEGGSIDFGAGIGGSVSFPGDGRGGPSATTITTPGVGVSASIRVGNLPRNRVNRRNPRTPGWLNPRMPASCPWNG
jgi:RHS repeat-associated protein